MAHYSFTTEVKLRGNGELKQHKTHKRESQEIQIRIQKLPSLWALCWQLFCNRTECLICKESKKRYVKKVSFPGTKPSFQSHLSIDLGCLITEDSQILLLAVMDPVRSGQLRMKGGTHSQSHLKRNYSHLHWSGTRTYWFLSRNSFFCLRKTRMVKSQS